MEESTSEKNEQLVPVLEPQESEYFSIQDQYLETFASFLPSSTLVKIRSQPEGVALEPHWSSFEGVLMMADLSGFTKLCEDFAHGRAYHFRDTHKKEAFQRKEMDNSEERWKLDAQFISRIYRFTESETAGYGAEGVLHLLANCFGSLIEEVEAAGGDVIRVAGDALIVVFPISNIKESQNLSDQEAQRQTAICAAACAARCVKRLGNSQKAIRRMESTVGIQEPGKCKPPLPLLPLQLHVGLALGSLTSYCVGGSDYGWQEIMCGGAFTQVGEALHLASAGDIVVSAQVAALLQSCSDWKVAPIKNGYSALQPAVSVPMLEQKDKMIQVRQDLIWSWKDKDVTQTAKDALWGFTPLPVYVEVVAEETRMLSEIQRVTVLFAKINITLTEDQDESLKLLQQVFRTVQGLLAQYEGILKEFTVDDKGMVVIVGFGLRPHIGHRPSYRACLCALDFTETLSEKLETRCYIGVTTGPVFCASLGSDTRKEFAFVSDTVNIAAGLMIAAQETHNMPDLVFSNSGFHAFNFDSDSDYTKVFRKAVRCKSQQKHSKSLCAESLNHYRNFSACILTDLGTSDLNQADQHLYFERLPRPPRLKNRRTKIDAFLLGVESIGESESVGSFAKQLKQDKKQTLSKTPTVSTRSANLSRDKSEVWNQRYVSRDSIRRSSKVSLINHQRSNILFPRRCSTPTGDNGRRRQTTPTGVNGRQRQTISSISGHPSGEMDPASGHKLVKRSSAERRRASSHCSQHSDDLMFFSPTHKLAKCTSGGSSGRRWALSQSSKYSEENSVEFSNEVHDESGKGKGGVSLDVLLANKGSNTEPSDHILPWKGYPVPAAHLKHLSGDALENKVDQTCLDEPVFNSKRESHSTILSDISSAEDEEDQGDAVSTGQKLGNIFNKKLTGRTMDLQVDTATTFTPPESPLCHLENESPMFSQEPPHDSELCHCLQFDVDPLQISREAFNILLPLTLRVNKEQGDSDETEALHCAKVDPKIEELLWVRCGGRADYLRHIAFSMHHDLDIGYVDRNTFWLKNSDLSVVQELACYLPPQLLQQESSTSLDGLNLLETLIIKVVSVIGGYGELSFLKKIIMTSLPFRNFFFEILKLNKVSKEVREKAWEEEGLVMEKSLQVYQNVPQLLNEHTPESIIENGLYSLVDQQILKYCHHRQAYQCDNALFLDSVYHTIPHHHRVNLHLIAVDHLEEKYGKDENERSKHWPSIVHHAFMSEDKKQKEKALVELKVAQTFNKEFMSSWILERVSLTLPGFSQPQSQPSASCFERLTEFSDERERACFVLPAIPWLRGLAKAIRTIQVFKPLSKAVKKFLQLRIKHSDSDTGPPNDDKGISTASFSRLPVTGHCSIAGTLLHYSPKGRQGGKTLLRPDGASPSRRRVRSTGCLDVPLLHTNEAQGIYQGLAQAREELNQSSDEEDRDRTSLGVSLVNDKNFTLLMQSPALVRIPSDFDGFGAPSPPGGQGISGCLKNAEPNEQKVLGSKCSRIDPVHSINTSKSGNENTCDNQGYQQSEFEHPTTSPIPYPSQKHLPLSKQGGQKILHTVSFDDKCEQNQITESSKNARNQGRNVKGDPITKVTTARPLIPHRPDRPPSRQSSCSSDCEIPDMPYLVRRYLPNARRRRLTMCQPSGTNDESK